MNIYGINKMIEYTLKNQRNNNIKQAILNDQKKNSQRNN
jgi:hypothetical protein